jgi:hypothetical protein
MLRAPGILRNPVPVEAPFDRSAAHEVTLRNLLQRRGYEGLEEGRARGSRKCPERKRLVTWSEN